jgi:hypothetical protein
MDSFSDQVAGLFKPKLPTPWFVAHETNYKILFHLPTYTPMQRKSYNTTDKIYFLTATVHKWQSLLEDDENKQLIIDYLK